MKVSKKKMMIAAIIGVLALIAFTMIHLLIVGFDNFGINYLIIPAIVGILSGSLISYYYQKQKIEMLSKIQIMKENEKKLNQINKNLENLVKERTAELQNSNDKLSLMNATKDKFFSIIAHDLKNPIWAAKQIMDVLYEAYDAISEEEKKELLDEIRASTNSTYQLLMQLLDWSRSQRGVIEFNPQNIDLNFLVSSNTDLLKTTADEKSIELINQVPKDTMVYADVNMLVTILRNLISNAIKFTDLGGKIAIYCNPDKFVNHIEITVEDNGVGISEENQQKLFRIDTGFTTLGTNKEKGTGLGLILIKEFVEKHGGSIKVESKEGQGSKFIFTIPKEKIENNNIKNEPKNTNEKNSGDSC